MSYRADEFSQLSKRMPIHGNGTCYSLPTSNLCCLWVQISRKDLLGLQGNTPANNQFLARIIGFFQHQCTGVIVHRHRIGVKHFWATVRSCLFFATQFFVRSASRQKMEGQKMVPLQAIRARYSGVLLDWPGCSHTYLGTPKPENWARNR